MNAGVVSLDSCEVAMATACAAWRVARASGSMMGKGHGEGGHSLERRDLPGAVGEMAAAKYLGSYWGGGSQHFRDLPDVAGFEVRAATHEHGHLIVFETDQDETQLLLVIVRKDNTCRIVGTAMVADVRVDRYRKAPSELRQGSPPQWWVPQAALEFVRQPLAEVAK